MKSKKFLILLAIIVIIVTSVILLINKGYSNKAETNYNQNQSIQEQEETVIIGDRENKIDVIDINSKTRPYAISVNNTPVAVKVQTGLNKAYLVYEIQTDYF